CLYNGDIGLLCFDRAGERERGRMIEKVGHPPELLHKSVSVDNCNQTCATCSVSNRTESDSVLSSKSHHKHINTSVRRELVCETGREREREVRFSGFSVLSSSVVTIVVDDLSLSLSDDN